MVWNYVFGGIGVAYVVGLVVLAVKFDIGNNKRIYMRKVKK